MFVIVVVGKMRAGKDTALGYLMKFFDDTLIPSIGFSDVLVLLLNKLDLNPVRGNFQKYAMCLKEAGGGDIFRRSVGKSLREYEGSERIFLHGARFLDDLSVVDGIPHVILGIETRDAIRFERAKKDGKDNCRALEEFRAAENQPTEGEIDRLMERANAIIPNNGTLAEFEENLRVWFDKVFPSEPAGPYGET